MELTGYAVAALMLDGLELKSRCCVVALGVTTDGVKVPLGLWDGSTENKRVCVELLANLVDRGLDCDQGVLVTQAISGPFDLGRPRKSGCAPTALSGKTRIPRDIPEDASNSNIG